MSVALCWPQPGRDSGLLTFNFELGHQKHKGPRGVSPRPFCPNQELPARFATTAAATPAAAAVAATTPAAATAAATATATPAKSTTAPTRGRAGLIHSKTASIEFRVVEL